MPLHLLGKKSWNVYNPANIARVKRDEAEAAARAEAEEKQLQDLEAERRLAILRGEVPPALPPPLSPPQTSSPGTRRKRERDDGPAGQTRGTAPRKRKRFGEDDTDFEMRVAREQTAATAATTSGTTRSHGATKSSDAPLVDARGHISLFPEDGKGRDVPEDQKNEEAEREAAKKRRDFEDQYTMRFANAAGRDGIGVTGSGPWYASKGANGPRELVDTQEVPGKDVWGNDDPKRKARDAARVVANDPLAMMKRGAAKVRDVERERRALNEEKAKELKQLRKQEKRREGRRRHDGFDELEGFSLDARTVHERDRNREHRPKPLDSDGREKHRHRHRSEHSSHSSHSRGDREDWEKHSSAHSRRRSARTDHY